MDTCRDRFGKFPSTVFNVYACVMCYQYLIDLRTPNSLVRKKSVLKKLLPSLWTTTFPNLTWPETIQFDFMNNSVFRTVCSTLKETDCRLWTDCCDAARRCCYEQMTTAVMNSDRLHCPRTWDGFSCVNDTMAGATASLKCPPYIIGSTSETELARKYCTENGSWYKDEVKGQEWTDYTPCVQLENYRIMFNVAVICHVTSLALTVPASLIFLAFRQLRQQHRLKIHLNLFLSFMLTNVVWILWENLVYNDRLEKAENTFMHRDTAGCKILYALTRYTISTNFFWMFLESVYLLRLIVNAFVLPTSLAGYYVFGWVGPLVFLLIYIGFRIYHEDGGCWVYMMAGNEWWIYTPNLVILLTNVVSLAWIIYTLTTQIHVHPNEPSCYRRALKAMIVLTPLFGLQMLFVIYRPINGENLALEITATIFKSSQIESYIKKVKDRLSLKATTSESFREPREADINLKIQVYNVSSTVDREVECQ